MDIAPPLPLDTVAIPFRRPRLLDSPLLRRLVSTTLFAPVGFLAMAGPGGLRAVPLLVAAGLGLTLIFLLRRAWWIRHGGQPPPLAVGAEGLVVPPSLELRRTTRVPLRRLRSAAVIGAGRQARLVIDAGWRQFSYPVRLLEAGAVERLHEALQARLTADPAGDARWQAIAARHDFAARARHTHPIATWSALALLAACFSLQMMVATDDPLQPLMLGADAPLLVRAGEWWRLVTANLLHANPYHLLANAGALLIYGSFVERLAGLRRTVLVMLAGGILAHAASAALGLVLQLHLYSIGASGLVFALLGALAAIIWRFGNRIPGGLQPPGPAWWILLIAYAVAVAVMVPQIDSAAHAGGAVAGILLGALICGSCVTTQALRRPGRAVTAATLCLGLVWIVALGIGVMHALQPAARPADEARLVAGWQHGPPPLQNDVAWGVAIDPAAGPALLAAAAALARQAVARTDPTDPALPAYVDTRAALLDRAGDPGAAALLELPLIGRGASFAGHAARFLDRSLRQDGFRDLGTPPASLPVLAPEAEGWQLTAADAGAAGARLYAVVRRGDVAIGLLVFILPPHFSGTQHVRPQDVPAGAHAVLALDDARSCGCTAPAPAPAFHAAVDDLPP